jgi:hypothetical protein
MPDPNFSIPDPDPGSKRFWIQDPGSGSASKNLRIFYPKNVSKLSEFLSENVHPGYGS